MNAVKHVLILLLILLALVFAVQNPEPVPLRVLPNDPPLRLPLYVVVFLAMLAGIVVTALVQALGRLRLQRTIRRQQQAIAALEQTLKAAGAGELGAGAEPAGHLAGQREGTGRGEP